MVLSWIENKYKWTQYLWARRFALRWIEIGYLPVFAKSMGACLLSCSCIRCYSWSFFISMISSINATPSSLSITPSLFRSASAKASSNSASSNWLGGGKSFRAVYRNCLASVFCNTPSLLTSCFSHIFSTTSLIIRSCWISGVRRLEKDCVSVK